MATSPRPAPGSLPPDGGPGGRLHIHGITEMPAGYDAEVAELFQGSALGERTVGSRSRGPACDAHRGGAGARAGCALCPAAHGPRPTAWWRPTAPCSTSMCGRCCGASMPRSTQAWSGLSRRQCPTFPSWRPLTTSSTNSKGSQPRPSLRPLSPSPCRRVSRRQPRQGRRKRRRTGGGPRRARLKAPNPKASASASAAAASAASAATAALGAAAKRSAAGASPRRRAAAAAAASIPHAPWTAARSQGPVTGSAASSPARRCRCRRRALEEKPAKKRWPWKAIIKWGVAALVILGIAAGLWLWLAKPGGLLGSGARAARRQNVQQERANHHRSERSAKPEGRPPARPLLTRPPKLYLRT